RSAPLAIDPARKLALYHLALAFVFLCVSASHRHRLRLLSRSISARLRSNPHRYPPSFPVPRMTRWHGIASAIVFVAQARATARTADGLPIPAATSPYDCTPP